MDQDHNDDGQERLGPLELLNCFISLSLAALGARMALHLILRHHPFRFSQRFPSPSSSSHHLSPPSSSSSVGEARAAFLVLVMCGQATLALHLIFILTRWSFPTLEFFLLKVMALVCPLLFGTASIAFFKDRYRGRQNQRNHSHHHHHNASSSFRLTSAPLKPQPSRFLGSSSEMERAPVWGVWTERSATGSCVSPWREAASRAPQHSLFDEPAQSCPGKTDPEPLGTQERLSEVSSRKPENCNVRKAVNDRVTQSQSSSRVVSSALAAEDIRGGAESDALPKTETRKAGEAESHLRKAPPPPPPSQPPNTADRLSWADYLRWLTLGYLWSVAIGLSVMTLLEPGIYPCFLHARSDHFSLDLRRDQPQRMVYDMFYFDICPEDVPSLVFLYCAFYIPLLSHLVYSLVQSVPRRLWSRGVALLSDEEDDNNDEDGGNANGLASSGKMTGDLQDKRRHGSTTLSFADATTTAHGGKAAPTVPGNASVPETAESSNTFLTNQRRCADSPTDNLSNSPTTPVSNSGQWHLGYDHSNFVGYVQPQSAEQRGQPSPVSVRHSFKHLPSQRSASNSKGDVRGNDDCVMCRQMAPYAVLTTAVLLVQFVLVLPMWMALRWEQTGLLKIPTPPVLLPPAYCAVCCIFWKIGNLNRHVF